MAVYFTPDRTSAGMDRAINMLSLFAGMKHEKDLQAVRMKTELEKIQQEAIYAKELQEIVNKFEADENQKQRAFQANESVFSKIFNFGMLDAQTLAQKDIMTHGAGIEEKQAQRDFGFSTSLAKLGSDLIKEQKKLEHDQKQMDSHFIALTREANANARFGEARAKTEETWGAALTQSQISKNQTDNWISDINNLYSFFDKQAKVGKSLMITDPLYGAAITADAIGGQAKVLGVGDPNTISSNIMNQAIFSELQKPLFENMHKNLDEAGKALGTFYKNDDKYRQAAGYISVTEGLNNAQKANVSDIIAAEWASTNPRLFDSILGNVPVKGLGSWKKNIYLDNWLSTGAMTFHEAANDPIIGPLLDKEIEKAGEAGAGLAIAFVQATENSTTKIRRPDGMPVQNMNNKQMTDMTKEEKMDALMGAH